MVFNKITSILLFPIYHLIHRNRIFGYIHKKLIKNFYYKKFKFYLDERFIPLKNYSSFLFKTYEYNDRILPFKGASLKMNKSPSMKKG